MGKKSSNPSTEKLDNHIQEWTSCEKCQIGCLTTQKVFFRGSCPAEILFVGEAPGQTEDDIGLPFMGRSGQLLNQMIQEMENCSYPKKPPTWAITNTVLCTPYEPGRTKIRTPTKQEILNCSSRLSSFISLISPKTIIAVGKQAEKALALLKLPYTGIYHPSFILRNGGLSNARGLIYYKKNIMILKKAIDSDE